MRIVTTHKNTDFDGLASLVAATLLYPDSIPVLPKSVNPNVKGFLSFHKDVFRICSSDEIDLEKVQGLIVVDVNNWERLDRIDALKTKDNLEVILWDHHLKNQNIHPTWQCVEEVGATITLMVRQLKADGKELTPVQATLFLAGLYEDTGNLTFLSSKAEDAYAAAYLLERKADLNVLSSLLRPAYGEKQKDILFEMLQSPTRMKINGYYVSINKLDIKGHVGNLSVVVHMYGEIMNVEAVFGIFTDRDRDRCIVIGRSNVDGLDVGSIMRTMGGGGHPGAGSAMLKSVNPEVVEEWIRELIQGSQGLSVQVSDLMSFPVFSVPSDTSMQKVAFILREKGCTGIPVVDEEKLAGIISRRDFRKIKKETQLKSPVKAFMSTQVVTIAPEKNPMQAVRLMVKHDIGRLPVVKEGRIIGIITRSDAMRYVYDMMPG